MYDVCRGINVEEMEVALLHINPKCRAGEVPQKLCGSKFLLFLVPKEQRVRSVPQYQEYLGRSSSSSFIWLTDALHLENNLNMIHTGLISHDNDLTQEDHDS